MSEYSEKLSSGTKLFLKKLPENASPELNILVRIYGPLNEDRRSQIESLVIAIRSVAVDIVVVTAPPEAVLSLAKLEFVKYIEVSGPLYLE